jgi:hypothetical protein
MSGNGIESFDALVALYLASGFIIFILWALLEAHVVLGPSTSWPDRELARLRVTRWLSYLGPLHVGFALIALHAARTAARESDAPAVVAAGHRARSGAIVSFAVGALVVALAVAPHVVGVRSLPGVTTIAETAPWEH